ncbi:MAG TPA: glycosyltransferase family 2 protein [Planctomycetota bacterium]|nr:glycosyltransferase family 2 protein [Planctomycetota bacterium]
MRLTVILPFFNEAALLPSLPDLFARVRSALAGHDVRLLAVDDGSTDGTGDGLARIEGLDVVRHPGNRGVGAAMATGITEATGEAAVVFDPDEAYAPEVLPRLVDALRDADVATASPYHPEGGVEGVGAFRLLLSQAASILYRLRTRAPLRTFTCAVRAYRLPAARGLLPAPGDFTAAAYLLAKALAMRLRVVEVPARLRVRRAGTSKMRLFRTARAHLRLLRDLPMTPPGSQ